jgi:hypothetical protein
MQCLCGYPHTFIASIFLFTRSLNEQHYPTMLLPRLLSPKPVHLVFSSHLQIFREQRRRVSAFLDNVKGFHHSHGLRSKRSGLTECTHNCTPFVTVFHPLHFHWFIDRFSESFTWELNGILFEMIKVVHDSRLVAERCRSARNLNRLGKS